MGPSRDLRQTRTARARLAAPASSAAQPSTAPASASASASANTCSQYAATHIFLYLVSATAHSGSLTLTAKRATVVCGGPDDLHYDVSPATMTAQVSASATISIFSMPADQPQPTAPAELGQYLQTDTGTRIFLVSGPLSAITGLQEEYHP